MAWEVASEAPAPAVATHTDFAALMDKTFGAGKWRQTGGYRTPEREVELRAQGAETVPAGHVSAHSKGTPDDPGAYDIVVDGLNPRQVARKLQETGADFVHFYPEGSRATQGAHLHVAVPVGGAKTGATASDDWQVASEAPIAKTAPKSPENRSAMGELWESVKDVPREIGKQLDEVGAANKNRSAQRITSTKKGLLREFVDTATDTSPIHTLLDPLGALISGATTSLIGRPVEAATGIPRRVTGDIASLAIPVAGELNEARAVANIGKETGVGNNLARQILMQRRAATAAPRTAATVATDKPTLAEATASLGPVNAVKALAAPVDPAHAARVARLENDGIFVTPGSRLGGKAKIIEDASTSDPYRGQALVEARNHSVGSLNRAVYNRALAPIGEKVGDAVAVGRDGVKYVGQKLGAAYDKLLPTIKVEIGDEEVAKLAQIEKSSAKLGKPQEDQFKAIIDQDVLHHLPIGQISDGRTFKAVQSDLLRQSRAFKGSQDPNQRALGHALEDVLDVLTESAERHSPPGTAAPLKKINEGFAIFTRIQDAATRRLATQPGANPGTFTPLDLVAAVRKGDRTVRKGAFARGDALLQQLAEDAEAVLPSKVGDSGTATRLNVTRPGPLGAGIGGVVGGIPGAIAGAALESGARTGTNALARNILMTDRKAPMVRNYLRAAQRRLDAHHAARAVAAAGTAGDIGDQQ